jgi:hypothetical protein
MEPRLQQRLEIPADHFLSDAVGDRGYAQRPRSPICFRNIHPPNRWWKVAPRGQPIPQLIEIIGQIGLKRLYRLSIYASRSLVGPHFLEGLPDLSLRDVERLCLDHAAPPVTGWPPAKAGYRCPFGPAPLQGFQPYSGQLRPCALHRQLDPRRVCRLGRFPWHQDDRFPRSVQKPVPESRRLRAGCRLGRPSGLRPNLSRDDHRPRFRHRRCLFDRSSTVCFRSSLRDTPQRDQVPPFLQRSPPPLLTAAACSGLHPAPDRRMRGASPHLLHSSIPPSSSVCSWHTVIQALLPCRSHPSLSDRIGLRHSKRGTNLSDSKVL